MTYNKIGKALVDSVTVSYTIKGIVIKGLVASGYRASKTIRITGAGVRTMSGDY